MNKKFYYAKVTDNIEDINQQVELFLEHRAKKREIFKEEKTNSREVWEKLMSKINSGDKIIVKSLKIFGDNSKEASEVIKNLFEKNIKIESIEQSYIVTYLRKKWSTLCEEEKHLFLETLIEVDDLRAKWEYQRFREKITKGRDDARKRGVIFGRVSNQQWRKKFKKLYPLTKLDRKDENYRTIVSVAKELKCSRAQFYIMEREYKKEFEQNSGK